jgi:hypothetical protein
MIQNGSSEVTKQFQDTFKVQTIEGTLSTVATSVTPVYVSNPLYAKIIASGTRTATGAGTVYTTPTDKLFFLTHLSLSSTQNATADQILVVIKSTVGGKVIELLSIDCETLTARSTQTSISFPFPILLDKGVTITLTQAFTVGSGTARCCLSGFTI